MYSFNISYLLGEIITAKKFYKSASWRTCRDAYFNSSQWSCIMDLLELLCPRVPTTKNTIILIIHFKMMWCLLSGIINATDSRISNLYIYITLILFV